MTAYLSEVDDVADSVEGAVIEKLEAGDGGLQITLTDGRFLIFPDALIVAVCSGKRTIQ